MSSEKLQALPGEPLILVTSHTLTVSLPHCRVRHTHLCGLLRGLQVAASRLEFSSAVYFPTTSPPAPCSLAALDEVTLPCSLPFPLFLSLSLGSLVVFLPLSPLSVPLFFWMGPFTPSAPPVSFCPFFAFLPPPTIKTPAAAQTSSTKQAEGSHTQLANSRATESSKRPMRSSGVCACTNQGRFFSTSGLDRRN